MSDPAPFFDRVCDLRVLVCGDVMLDRYETGTIDRVSPEAPVPVLRRRGGVDTLGGAGNVAANAASLGARTHLFGRIGRDPAGDHVLRLAHGHGLATDGVWRDDAVATITKTRFVSGGQQVLRVDDEDLAPLSQPGRDRLLTALGDALGSADALILSDYAKGLFDGDLAAAMIEAARASGTPTIVDPKGRDFSRYRGADLVTPNRSELALATGLPVTTDREVIAAARQLISEHRLGAVMVTRSEDGLSLITPDAALHVPAEAREVFDVSGAGDTVVATFALARAAGLDLGEAARLANTAAGLVVGKRGTAQVSAGELREALRRRGEIPGRLRTAISRDDARAAIRAWRDQGLRVGFTNGCFDILHFGHASLLERARALCDRLVVGLNGDASVARLKGPGRPVNPEADRAALLLALRSVDAVVVFDEDTPYDLIAALEPDLLVKGADYAPEAVVGADLVTARGGEVRTLALETGRSTTSILARGRPDPERA